MTIDNFILDKYSESDISLDLFKVEDALHVYGVRNDVLVRNNLIDSKYIKLEGFISQYISFVKDFYECENSLLTDDIFLKSKKFIWIIKLFEIFSIGYIDVTVREDEVEFGIKILPAFWHRNIANISMDMAILRLKYIFRNKNIVLTVFSDNEVAMNIYTKRNFVVESIGIINGKKLYKMVLIKNK